YRLSDIMKTLTIFSVIVFPLTLLAAIFGMNIMGGMPFTESKDGFWIIIAIMLLGCFCMLLFFKKKKWL
ncbi:magnesium and cobalt transport protein CorA, partial [Patescibacteria group bacterium]|nr:magnesium and cobalt transport protein CorA [Patescibacteria group bacterium]MBU4600466.1 magnesium and cobalt transport protein CorA [Patescibacteria group bacterium]